MSFQVLKDKLISRMEDLKKIDQTAIELSTEVSSSDQKFINEELIELHGYVCGIIRRISMLNEKLQKIEVI